MRELGSRPGRRLVTVVMVGAFIIGGMWALPSVGMASTRGIAIRPDLLIGQIGSVTRSNTPVGNAPTRLTASLLPADGAVVGVGQPIVLTLSRPIDEPGRSAIEQRLQVHLNGAPAAGDWGWMTSQQVWFRPYRYWPAKAEVTVTADLAGVSAGEYRNRPLAGGLDQDRRWTFRTGPAVISYVDGATYQMTVTVDGEAVRVIPVSLGKPGFETRDGVKVIAEKHERKRMTSDGQNLPEAEQYDVEVSHAARLTWTGEFVHAAPWAAHRIGRAHGSHGCVNVTAADAQWFYDNAAAPGDVVVFTNSGPAMELWNGYGGPWNLTAAQWRTRSALATDALTPPAVPDRMVGRPAGP